MGRTTDINWDWKKWSWGHPNSSALPADERLGGKEKQGSRLGKGRRDRDVR